jgi:type IV pilus assembly protein PilY1
MKRIKKLAHSSLALGMVLGANIGFSAPGEIKDRPLFLGFSVQPNIYFVVDDSGSMAWDVTKTTEANELYAEGRYTFTYQFCWDYDSGRSRTKSQVPNCSGSRYDLLWDTDTAYLFDGSGQYIDWSPDDYSFDYRIYDTAAFAADYPFYSDDEGYTADELLEWCVGYNATAYDPNIEYTPWVGYSDSTNSPSSGSGYIPWNDDGDGVFERGECSIDNDDRVYYSSMSADQQQNFRNWNTYYRSRQNVAKKAISEVVADSEARMGLATINRGQYYSVQDMEVASNKSSLLSQVFSVPASGGTPLRTALQTAGEYFKGSSSPIESEDDGGSCQQNYTVLMTDGFWNGSSPSVGNVDGTLSDSLVRDSDRDNYSNTLADVALKYYATDLKTDLDNEVPTIDGVDENSAQHMVTFTVAFGVNGEVVPNDTTSGRETDEDGMPLYPDQSFDWPQVTSNTDSTIDDVRHAAWNGHGLYLSAKDPESLIESLQASIDEIESRTGTASALAFNSTSYRTDSKFYYAQFTSGSWAGELIAQELTEDLESGSVVWKATDEIDSVAHGSREILTYDPSTNKGVAFTTGSLPAAHYADLKTLFDSEYNAYYTESDFISDAVDYLRGDRSNEGASAGSFRDRSTALGDIINSTPVFIGGSASFWPAFIEPGYLSYISDVSSRDAVLYVGANDGMLHAISAEDGSELFAFMPSGILSTDSDKGIHYLVDQDYNHRYYVDSTVEVADGYIGSSWKTVLVSGLGAGGKSIFALDVTDPTTISESNAGSRVLWEVEMDDLGLTYSQPKVAKMNDGTWVVVVGNGYHNTKDGRAKVFLLKLSDGSLYKTFDTGVGSLSSGDCGDACNGMSQVTPVDLDGNGTTDMIYAGDLKGNVWAINTDSVKSSEWVFDSEITYDEGIVQSYTGGSVEPVFTAEGNRPITTEILVETNSVKSGIETWPNQLLFFGTGQFIANGDHDSTAQEHVYSVMHANSVYEMSLTDTPELFLERIIEEDVISAGGESLVVRSIVPADPDEEYFEFGANQTASGEQQRMGWFIELPSSGERVVFDPVKVSDYAFFNTLVPESDPCAFGASGFTMAISLPYGLNPETAILDFNNDGVIDSEDEGYAGYELDSPPAGLTKLGNKGLGQSTFDEPEFIPINLDTGKPNRISWEDLK